VNAFDRVVVTAAAAVTLSVVGFVSPVCAQAIQATATEAPPMTGHASPGNHPSGASHEHEAAGEQRRADMMEKHAKMMAMHGNPASANLSMPGQDAFGAIAELVHKLDADPKTDWSKVNLEALRQHLIDMNEVTLKAEASATAIDGGLDVAVTGTGRTLTAIQRMVPAHAAVIDGVNGWSVRSESLPDGVRLIVTSSDPRQIARIRGLGFIGILATGDHHLPHHFAISTGESPHAH
jgi:hypothetical protein